MSTIYGALPPNGFSGPPRKVNFNWINEAWQLFIRGKSTWIASVLTVFALPAMVSFFLIGALGGAAAMSGGRPLRPLLWLELGVPAFFTLYFAFFNGGLYRMGIMQARGEIISIVDVFRGGRVFLRMLGLMLLYSILVGIGLWLFVVPGVDHRCPDAARIFSCGGWR